MLWLKRNGREESTIKSTGYKLRLIAKNADLDNPESVKDFISNHNGSVNYKNQLANAYQRYTKYHKIEWTKPKFRSEEYVFTLPTEERIDSIIAVCHLKHAFEFTIMKEHGLRPIEIYRLRLKGIDLDKGIVNVKRAKNGRSRKIQLKKSTLAMMRTYVHKHNFGLDDVLFSTPKCMSKAFQRAKKSLANKLEDIEYHKIRLYDLRHFYATMLYYKTKDLFHVMNALGHKQITTILVSKYLLFLVIE